MGTTHADTFYDFIRCSRKLSEEEILNDYEANTGNLIIEEFKDLDYMASPAILVHSHGPFIWGKSASKALENAIILEEVAKMAFITKMLNPNVLGVDKYLMDKHYFRKHGKNAYYGQGE